MSKTPSTLETTMPYEPMNSGSQVYSEWTTIISLMIVPHGHSHPLVRISINVMDKWNTQGNLDHARYHSWHPVDTITLNESGIWMCFNTKHAVMVYLLLRGVKRLYIYPIRRKMFVMLQVPMMQCWVSIAIWGLITTWRN